MLAAASLLAACSPANGDRADRAPNVITITVDDATLPQINDKTMPAAMREIAGAGTIFDQFIVPMPLCCPSRAAYLTGQYGHNNGVLRNNYRELDEKSNILPRWLQGAGYRTMHVGKYLNNFTAALDRPEDVPAGWDEWYTALENKYFDYRVSDNGKLIHFGSDPDDYLTRVLNRKAVELVGEHADDRKPFYLQLDHHAPHLWRSGPDNDCRQGATPDPDDYPRLHDLTVPPNRSRNEADTSDKPPFLRSLKRLPRGELERAKTNYLCASAALRSVDRGIKALVEELEEKDALDNTAIFLTSDNGFFYGEHRIPAKKEFPYEENLHMPLLVRLPAGTGPATPVAHVRELTGNIDLAPTILDLAGADPCKPNGHCRKLDGRSLMPLLDPGDERDWPEDRALAVELDQYPGGAQNRVRPCSFQGVRYRSWLYVRYSRVAKIGQHCRRVSKPQIEVYNLRRDPRQLDNLAGGGRVQGMKRVLRRKMLRLRDCAGSRAEPGAGANACD